MPPTRHAQPARRRRGVELENALLDAAWAELDEKGYSGLTIESVAERAGTSRAVLYRRWPGKPELVRAAVAHVGAQERTRVPDTGSLRSDVIALLEHSNRSRARLGIQMTLQLAEYYEETGTSLADFHTAFLAGRAPAMQEVLARAIERGEADPERLTPRVVSVPFDLMRQELLMTLKPVPDATIAAIVDEVFLPLVSPDERS